MFRLVKRSVVGCQDLNLGPHPYQQSGAHRYATRRFPRSLPTVEGEVMLSSRSVMWSRPAPTSLKCKSARRTSTGRIVLGRRSGPGMTPAKLTPKIVYDWATAPDSTSKRIPQHTLGVLQVCPTCSPDRCSRRCGPIRAARPSRSDRLRSRVATCSRWCAGWPPRCATPDCARAKASDWSFRCRSRRTRRTWRPMP